MHLIHTFHRDVRSAEDRTLSKVLGRDCFQPYTKTSLFQMIRKQFGRSQVMFAHLSASVAFKGFLFVTLQHDAFKSRRDGNDVTACCRFLADVNDRVSHYCHRLRPALSPLALSRVSKTTSMFRLASIAELVK